MLRPAVHHVALPGHGVRERATTPQAVSLGSPPNSAYDMTSGELADKLRSLGVNWVERMRVRLTGINGKTLLETRKHELTQQAGISLHTAAVMQEVVREIDNDRGDSPSSYRARVCSGLVLQSSAPGVPLGYMQGGSHWTGRAG